MSCVIVGISFQHDRSSGMGGVTCFMLFSGQSKHRRSARMPLGSLFPGYEEDVDACLDRRSNCLLHKQEVKRLEGDGVTPTLCQVSSEF